MITFALHVLRLLPFLIGGHRQLALENPALRQHLAVYKRTTPHQAGRLFWAALARVGPGGGRHWFIVTPAIVLRWQRRRFRDYWTRLSCRPTAGRPPLDADRRRESFLGRPRIHGEFLKLGIEISERTVSMVMPKSRRCPSQPWRTFPANPIGDLVSIDFFTVPTARPRVLVSTVSDARLTSNNSRVKSW